MEAYFFTAFSEMPGAVRKAAPGCHLSMSRSSRTVRYVVGEPLDPGPDEGVRLGPLEQDVGAVGPFLGLVGMVGVSSL